MTGFLAKSYGLSPAGEDAALKGGATKHIPTETNPPPQLHANRINRCGELVLASMYRIWYITLSERKADKKSRMVLLHGFIKKTQKTAEADLELAKSNRDKHQRGLR